MPRITMFALVLAALLLAPAVVQAEDMIDNPTYVSWAKHKPGTKLKSEMTMDMGGQVMTMNVAQELKAVEKDFATVEAVSTMNIPGAPAGEGKKETVKVPAKVAPDRANLPDGADGTVKEVGRETVEMAGKRYDCKIVEFTGTNQGMKSSGKIWHSADMPGSTVKMDMTVESPAGPSKMSSRVVSVETK